MPKGIVAQPDDSLLDMDELMKGLIIENDFLTKVVDSIPAKMYFEHRIQERITAEKHLAMDKTAKEIKRKSGNHIELSVKGKHKRARLDPFTQKSVSQIHDELSKKRKKKRKKDIHGPSTSLTRAANIEELQKRLQDRIDLFQAKRKAVRSEPGTKKKLKQKVKKMTNKKKGNLLKTQVNNSAKPTEKNKVDKSSEKPVFNKEGNFIYSKFEFSENGVEHTKKNKLAGTQTKSLLQKAEKDIEKFEKLKSADPEKAEVVAEKLKWKKAILKSEGIKIRDDPKLLKKSLKKEERKKKRSTKEWKGRNEETEKRKKARQDKRERNIKQKKKEKKDRKIKLAKRRGRVVLNG